MIAPAQTNVRLLDLREQNLSLESELLAAFSRVLHSGTYIMGQEIERFEKATAEYLGVTHSITVSSGTDAILLALMALGIQPGDEVLCPSFTFFATAGCVSRLGATPVFIDSCPESFNLDLSDARKKITSRTKALMVVHLFGQAADLDGVQELAREFGLQVVEDAAQSFGARYRGKRVGTFGEFGTYSFFPSKNLGGIGDAGLLVTNDEVLAEKARVLRVHGSKPKYYHQCIGGNFRMDALQAALLGVKLPHHDSYSHKRQSNALYYQEALSKLPGLVPSGPSGQPPRIVIPVALPENDHIWNQFTLRLPQEGDRDALRKHLADSGIGTEIYYPVPLHEQECFGNLPESPCPGASRLAREVISLPIYPELPQTDRESVVDCIASFLRQSPTP